MDSSPISATGRDAVSILKGQHDRLLYLFKKLSIQSAYDHISLQMILEEIAIRLDIHSRLEEQLVYPKLRHIYADAVLRSMEEHDVAREMLFTLAVTEPSLESFVPKITVLRAMVERHMREEEREFFPLLASHLGENGLEKLGEDLLDLHQKITGETLAVVKRRSSLTLS